MSAGLPRHAEAALHRFIGPPLLSTFVELLTEHGRDPSGAHDCVAAYRDVYGEVSLDRIVVVPGVGRVLERLAGEVRLAVVTSKPAALERAPAWAGVSADPTRRADARMCGDRYHDIDAGRACGTATVGVTWGSVTNSSGLWLPWCRARDCRGRK